MIKITQKSNKAGMLRIVSTILSLLLFPTFASYAQICDTDITLGQNLVSNGDFSQGYTDWTFSGGYIKFDPPNTQNYSSPGFINAGATPSFFNSAFPDFNDHSPSADNMMLMVDGLCTAGAKLWQQTVPIKPNTTYYFSVWINALKNGNNPPGSLQFEINNSTAGLSISAITAPVSQGAWQQFEATWNSGPTPPATASISIENTTTSGCASFVDFAIDDITFIPGCQYSTTPVAVPNMGPDQNLCGGNNPITLGIGVTPASDVTVTWSSNVSAPTTGTGLGAPYTKTINTPGTYSVCVQKGAACLRSDVVVITSNYSFDIGGPYELCSPIAQVLDAQHSGTGVTYRWYYKTAGTAWVQADTITGPASRTKTYTATKPGRYRVVVTDAVCGTQEDETTVTSTATATPIDAHFCPSASVTLGVNGSGTGVYNWYSVPTGGSILSGGTNTTTFVTPVISGNTTYYVEDAEVKKTTVGPPSLNPAASRNQTGHSDKAILFHAFVPFTIDSATVYWWFDNNNGHQTDVINVQFKTTDSPANYNTTATTNTTGPAYSTTIAAATAAGKMFPPWPTSSNNIYGVRVPVGISVASAGDYRLAMANANGNVIIQQSLVSYNYNDAATNGDIAVITASKLGNNPITSTEYHDIYNWKISYKTPCARIPVNAIADCILPVELVQFTAARTTGKLVLHWITSSEISSDYFVIERSSDGIHFESAGTLKAAGNSQALRSYTFNDYNALAGTSYYRLAQYDLDGKVHYSEIKTVATASANIAIIPNPNNGSFMLTAQVENHSNVEISILNILGQQIYTASENTESGYFDKQINLSAIPSGLYFLNFSDGTNTWTEKVVVGQ